MRGTILITGASSGIGAATAFRLAGHGATVYAGVRRDEDGTALTALQPAIRPLRLDVTDPAQIEDARRRIEDETDGKLDGLVNNAGIAVAGPIEALPADAWQKQFDVNLFGLVATTRAFIPALRAARGRVVNVGSIAGKSSTPFLAPYSASKFAVEAFSDALRMELRRFGVRVTVIEPGVIVTPLWQRSSRTARDLATGYQPHVLALYQPSLDALTRFSAIAEQRGTPVERVAATIELALDAARPQHRYVIGLDARAQLVLNLLPSSWRDALIVKGLGLQ